jgi:hypothetical protein
MQTLETPKALVIVAMTSLLVWSNPAAAADEVLRCEAKAIHIEAKALRCIASCRDIEERRVSFDEDRCVVKCGSHYDDAYSRLLCPADRLLVRSMQGVGATALRCEARTLQGLARALRCSAGCEDTDDPESCRATCDDKYAAAGSGDSCQALL